MLGVAKDRQDLNSEEASSTPGVKAKKTQSSEESNSRNAKDKKTETTKEKGKASKKHGSPVNVAKPSTDCKLEQLDQKWLKRFSRLEAVLLSKVFTQPDPVF